MSRKKAAAAAVIIALTLLFAVGCSVKIEPSVPDATTGTKESESTVTTTEPTTEKPTEEDKALSALRREIGKKNCKAGIAYLGYVDSNAGVGDLRKSIKGSDLAEKYPFLCELFDSNFVAHEGTELYAVVPQSSDYTVTVYESKMTDSGEYKDNKKRVIYRSKPGDIVILRCNVSELYSNVLISVSKKSDSLEFHPVLSMVDSRIATEEGCYDFSDYDSNENERKNIKIASELLSEADVVQYYIDKGMTLQYTGETRVIDGRSCWIFALGTDHGDRFVREFYYGVCDNLIYSYDAVSDKWSVLGAG